MIELSRRQFLLSSAAVAATTVVALPFAVDPPELFFTGDIVSKVNGQYVHADIQSNRICGVYSGPGPKVNIKNEDVWCMKKWDDKTVVIQ